MTPLDVGGAGGATAAPAALGPTFCPCGGEMWFLPFGYESWVCRRDPRHWFRPNGGRWSQDAEMLADEA
jgi:hypothetical protein